MKVELTGCDLRAKGTILWRLSDELVMEGIKERSSLRSMERVLF